MDKGLLTVKEASDLLWGSETLHWQRKTWELLENGKLPGAFRLNGTGRWIIPRGEIDKLVNQ
jgi:hypothetical protein|tara:strand:+ start:895 stop:1080 length:186 start_codon:yes stop_codon:yes gene_type:complete